MPTISQLPATAQVTAADQLPISQGGSACSVSVGTLLASTQPAILAATGTLLGRTSLGPGGPDPVEVGIGLALNNETLNATGTDHATFPIQGVLTVSDEVVLSSTGNPKLLPLSALRGLFSPGSNISIDQNGTISAESAGMTSTSISEYSVASLPTVTTISPTDLVAISQTGLDHTISYSNFIGGQTIDQVGAATEVSDADSFLSAQTGNVMLRQTMAAVWSWINSKLPSYQAPTLELTSNTALSSASHNGRILICSQPIAVNAAINQMGTGFACNLINVSVGNVTFGSGITSTSGTTTLGPGQVAKVTCVTYSGGTVVYAWTSGAAS